MSTAEHVPSSDVLEVLILDHRVLERLFDDVKAKPLGDGREAALTCLVSELLTHLFVEEQVLYPAIRTALAGGDELVDSAVEEHQALKQTLARLEAVDPNDHEAEILLAHLQRDLRDHVEQEESALFLMFRSAVDEGDLLDMAELVERARETDSRFQGLCAAGRPRIGAWKEVRSKAQGGEDQSKLTVTPAGPSRVGTPSSGWVTVRVRAVEVIGCVAPLATYSYRRRG